MFKFVIRTNEISYSVFMNMVISFDYKRIYAVEKVNDQIFMFD